jgi:hypothetical protein
MSTDINIAQLIIDHWKVFSPDEQKEIEQRVHDLVLLSLAQALEAAVTPQETVVSIPGVPTPIVLSAPAPGALSAAEVPFGDAGNYQDYTYDDFARLAEDNGVPPTSALGHWFRKSLGIEFDKSTPEIRRKVYADMVAFYASQHDGPVRAVPNGMPPMAVVQAPYEKPDLNICPSCRSVAKYVPAGVARGSGKPYNAFYSCQKDCKSSWNASKSLSWTTEDDWRKSFQKAHQVGV